LIFIENNVTRCDNSAAGEIKAVIALLFPREAEEDTPSCTWGEFVVGGGGHVGVAQTSKNAKMVICGLSAIEKKVRCDVLDGTRWAKVEQVRSMVERFNPKV
jgi:hypothetical protein